MASFSFGAGNAGKLLRIPLYLGARVATLLVPRTRDLWVFGSATGIADGAWALWQVANAHGERTVWLTGSARDAAAARSLGLPWAGKGTLRGFWLTARAAVTVVTHGFGDVNRYAATGGVIVQLWHGIPLKRIGLDAAVTTASPVPIARGAISKLLALLYRRTQRRIRVLPAASELVRGRLESAFGLGTAQVPVTGEPRADVLSAATPAERRHAARTRLAALLGGVAEDTPLVLYAPTWRDGADDPMLPASGDLTALRHVLDETGALLLMRSHHLGAGEYDSLGLDRVRLLGSDVVADITPLLPGMDVLITDYSSLAFDAGLVPLATLFFAPDLAAYRRSRGFYGTYEDVAGLDPAGDWSALIARLRAVLTDAEVLAAHVERARALSSRMHAYSDGRNTERVYRTVRALLAPRVPVNPGARAHGDSHEEDSREEDSSEEEQPT